MIGLGLVLGLAATLAVASAQPSPFIPGSQQSDLQVEPLSPFERRLVDKVRSSGKVVESRTVGPASGNARGMVVEGGGNAILNFSVTGRKYGVSLDGTGEVLIKNFRFMERRSGDRFGSGIILGKTAGTRGETYLSNAWIDLKERGPEPDYQLANNEAISVEGGNRPLNVRRTVMLGGQDAGVDTKGDVRIDASFIASGHRPVRIWNGAKVVIANSVVLAFEGFGGFWFGGGDGTARLEYYNCRFGRVGDRADQLTDRLPDWMIAKDPDETVTVQIKRLDADPFDRRADSFWVPAKAPLPKGYLK